MSMNGFRGRALPLKDGDVELVAGYLGCETAAVRAVMAVESRSKAYQDGRPIILNEPHVFYRELGKISRAKRDEAVSAGLAYKKWKTKPYLRTQAERYAWLDKAMKIDKEAALKSCSWGLGQVMGFNHAVCGLDTAEAFVKAMMHSKGGQLLVIARFIVGNKLQRHLRRPHNWRKFARSYNGPGYATHGYHTKLARAYANRPDSEKTVPPIPSDAALEALMGNAGPQEPVQPDPVPPPPDIPAQPDTPSQPPQSGFSVALLSTIFAALFGRRSTR